MRVGGSNWPVVGSTGESIRKCHLVTFFLQLLLFVVEVKRLVSSSELSHNELLYTGRHF